MSRSPWRITPIAQYTCRLATIPSWILATQASDEDHRVDRVQRAAPPPRPSPTRTNTRDRADRLHGDLGAVHPRAKHARDLTGRQSLRPTPESPTRLTPGIVPRVPLHDLRLVGATPDPAGPPIRTGALRQHGPWAVSHRANCPGRSPTNRACRSPSAQHFSTSRAAWQDRPGQAVRQATGTDELDPFTPSPARPDAEPSADLSHHASDPSSMDSVLIKLASRQASGPACVKRSQFHRIP